MKNDLIDNIYKMIDIWNETNYTDPEIVLVCNAKYYTKLVEEYLEKMMHIKNEYGIRFLNVMGIKVPVVISEDIKKDVDYILMFRKDYERLEKERLYSKIISMFNT